MEDVDSTTSRSTSPQDRLRLPGGSGAPVFTTSQGWCWQYRQIPKSKCRRDISFPLHFALTRASARVQPPHRDDSLAFQQGIDQDFVPCWLNSRRRLSGSLGTAPTGPGGAKTCTCTGFCRPKRSKRAKTSSIAFRPLGTS